MQHNHKWGTSLSYSWWRCVQGVIDSKCPRTSSLLCAAWTGRDGSKQPCRGITRWAHRVHEVGGVRVIRLHAPAPPTRAQTSSNDRPPCLKNSRRAAAEFSSLLGTGTFHFTLNQDIRFSPAAACQEHTANVCHDLHRALRTESGTERRQEVNRERVGPRLLFSEVVEQNPFPLRWKLRTL